MKGDRHCLWQHNPSGSSVGIAWGLGKRTADKNEREPRSGGKERGNKIKQHFSNAGRDKHEDPQDRSIKQKKKLLELKRDLSEKEP